MVFEKIRKNASLTTVAWSMLIIIGLYVGMFAYLNWHSIDAGIPIDNVYSNASDELESAQSDLQVTIKKMQDDFAAIGEADNTFLAAWNGLKGLGQALKIPFDYLNIAIKGYSALESTFELPLWVKNTIYIGIITFIVLLLYAILKGDQQKL